MTFCQVAELHCACCCLLSAAGKENVESNVVPAPASSLRRQSYLFNMFGVNLGWQVTPQVCKQSSSTVLCLWVGTENRLRRWAEV